MQRPNDHAIDLYHPDTELAAALTGRVVEVIARLSPAARSRLLAYFHLLEEPGSTLAELVVDGSGVMCLTLTHTGAPAGSRSN